MRYVYFVLQKRAADPEWSCVNWYSTPAHARSALRMVQMYRPEMQTRIERAPADERNRYF